MNNKTMLALVSICLLLIILLSSCKEADLPPGEYAHVCGDGVCSSKELGRCDIDCNTGIEAKPNIISPEDMLEQFRNRQRVYTPEERLEMGNPADDDEKIFVESFTSYIPEKDFRVANRYNLLSIGENISNVMGTLTGFQLREILKNGRLSSNTEAFGPRAAFYEQFLTLKAGKVVFGLEEDLDITSTYLLFKEDEPLFDYSMRLNGGIFKFFEGEIINFLGHEYFIEEVTVDYMTFQGVTIPDRIMFRDGNGVLLNQEKFYNDELNVTFEEDYLRIIIISDDWLKILPETCFVEYLREPEMLLTNRIDVCYQGLTPVPVFEIMFDNKGDDYKLSFTTNKNTSYNVPLVSFEPFKMGNENYNFVAIEGDSKSDYVIGKKDYFVISNNREVHGLTNVLRLISVKEKLIIFDDPALEQFYVYYEGTPGVNATADLIVDNVLHKVYIGENDTISVDLDGNGRINKDKVPIVTAGNAILKVVEVASDAVILSMTTPKELREDKADGITIEMIIREDGLSIDRNDLNMYEDGDRNALVGMNDYGDLFILEDYSDYDEQLGEDLIILHPLYQRFADVIVKGYE